MAVMWWMPFSFIASRLSSRLRAKMLARATISQPRRRGTRPGGNVRSGGQDCAGSLVRTCTFRKTPRRNKETRMDSPAGRSARTRGSAKLTAAAVSIALMATAGVALAAPKTDPGSPQQAQGNGPPPQAQDTAPAPQAQQNAPPPQAQRPASPPAGAKANGRQSAGKPGAVPAAQPPQAGGNGSGAGQSGTAHHGRPAPGEARGQGR